MKIDVYKYHGDPPPEPSPRLAMWVERIRLGNWKPNKRFRKEGYQSRASIMQIYVWEYLNVIYPLLKGVES